MIFLSFNVNVSTKRDVYKRQPQHQTSDNMKDNRDALDYGEMRVSKLFYKLFFPTLLGLLSSVLLNLSLIHIFDKVDSEQNRQNDAQAAMERLWKQSVF